MIVHSSRRTLKYTGPSTSGEAVEEKSPEGPEAKLERFLLLKWKVGKNNVNSLAGTTIQQYTTPLAANHSLATDFLEM